MRAPGHYDAALDCPNPARDAAGIAEGPAVCGEPLDPRPVKRIDLFTDRQARGNEPDVQRPG